jgi:hypothetical protein
VELIFMYRVLFFCRNNPAAGWQGKGMRDSLNSARLLAIMLQTGTRGKAIVLDASGKIVFSVG